MARPSKYSETIAEKILSRYADGETLSTICKDKNMPKRNTVYRWRQSYSTFGEAYLRAQEEHTDALVDEAGDIVDTEQNPQLAKVRADHRKWLASKLNRNKYGDKIEVNETKTLDISPTLALAVERMRAIGTGDVIDVPAKQLEEADSDTM